MRLHGFLKRGWWQHVHKGAYRNRDLPGRSAVWLSDPSNPSIPKLSITAPFHWKKPNRKSVIILRLFRAPRSSEAWSATNVTLEFVCWTSLPMVDTLGITILRGARGSWLVAPSSPKQSRD